jgi:KaiC/GvpD/RAD55 family RecA-like ATPase
MGATLPIPRELVDFLKLPGPQSMLLRGPPGSGKSSLSLALLQAFNGTRYYVTNRVPEDDVLMAFPWLGENGNHGIRLLDNTEADGVATAARALLKGSPALVSDLTSETREMTEFLWLPEPLQRAWSEIHPEKPSLIVIDSWDALVDSYLGSPGPGSSTELPSRGDIERALIRRMGRARTHLLFVLEREEQTQLDYLVNAVGVTSREVVQGRLERWLTIFKLRGVRIENPLYPFSLESARFECIVPVRPYGQLQGGRSFDPAPDALPGFLWPGSKAFAASFGRLPLGKSTLMEVGSDVPNAIPHLLLAPMLAHAIEHNGRVIFLPDSSTLPDDVWEALHGSVERRRFLAQVRFLLPPAGPNEGKSEFEPTIVRLGAPADGGAVAPNDDIGMDQFLRSGSTSESPGLFVVFLQGLAAIANSMGITVNQDVAQRLPGQIQTAVRGAPIHAIAIGPASSPLLDPLRSTAALRLHLRQLQGRIFMHASDPWTPAFVLTEGDATTPYGLLRVV